MKFTALLALASAVNAHMIMKSPKPYNSPNSSPLDGSGNDFPCKAEGGFADLAAGPVNPMTIGQPQTLSFTGSAVHGGGSCQVSIAKTAPGSLKVDKNTKWMVIHSIEGGCPADTTSSGGGNLPADPNGSGAGTFQFTIPDHPDIPSGAAVLAWTWNNRIGNREMYMNCASVKISGGSAKKRYASASYTKRQQSSLPDMFVANIGNGCSVPEGGDVQYPNPGSSLTTGPNFKPMQPVGNCGSSGSSGSSPAPSKPSGQASAKPSGQPSVAPSATSGALRPTANTIVPKPTGQNGPGQNGPISQSVGGGFATVSASGAASAPTAAVSSAAAAPQPSAPAPTPPSSPAESAAAPSGTSSAGTPSSGTSGSCTTGDWNCAADGKSFTRCIAGGTWSASIQMSQGLSCTPGISANFAYNLTGPGAKRDLQNHIMHRRNHLHGAISS